MTPGSNPSLVISQTVIEKNGCARSRQPKPRSVKTCYFSESKDRRRTKSPSLWSCLTVCFKDRPRREPAVDSQADGTEGRLGDVASKWPRDTQGPLVVHDGLFPTWFLGFTSRKGAEEILRGKETGCFLIRLSDKAIGYILSYKGRDRCRHFVINQSESGHLVVCGDTTEHDTVSDLLEHYKTSPIKPFGEYLTSSCYEGLNEELYDTMQVGPKENPVASAAAVKNEHKQQINLASEQPLTRPQNNSRTVEAAPPLPRRSSAHLNDQERVLYAQLWRQAPREIRRFHHVPRDGLLGYNPGRTERSTAQGCGSSRGPDSVYAEHGLLDSTNLSVPPLDHVSDAEHPRRLSASPQTPPRLYPKATRQATCYGPEKPDPCSRASSTHRLEYMSDNRVSHLAGMHGNSLTTLSETRSEQHLDSVYAEVHTECLVGRSPHANQMIFGHDDTVKLKTNSTYEPLENIRPKHNYSTWGVKNNKRR